MVHDVRIVEIALSNHNKAYVNVKSDCYHFPSWKINSNQAALYAIQTARFRTKCMSLAGMSSPKLKESSAGGNSQK